MREKISGIKKFFAFYVMLPVILDLVIESLNRKSLFAGLEYMINKPSLFLFNVLIIMLTLSIAMFFQREVFVLSLMAIIWLVFGIANYIILHFRVTPFSAVDFTLITSAISVSGHYLSALNIAMIIMAVVMLMVGVVCLFKKAPRYDGNTSRRAYIISGLVMLTLIGCIAYMHNSSTTVQALADNYTNISEAYENYGFVYCFANSILDTGIEKPKDYSQEKVTQIRDDLLQEKNTIEEKPNIIMIQLESFFDINMVKGLKFSSDPLPNFHRLQKEYPDGLLTVPTVGAGTVNTEFEILTGMSQHDFGVSEYPYKTVLKNTTSESICRDLSKLGYTSHGIHNNTATFYGRNQVFSHLGFDTFTSVEYMNDVTLNPNGWAKDDVLVDEIMDSLDSTEGADFTFGITVQSHGKYDGIAITGKNPVEVSGAPEGKEDTYQYYVNEIYEVDQMVGELLDRLEERDEPTVVVLYGDHLPSLDLQDEDLSNGNLYQTQYVIWNNYGLQGEDQDLNAYQLYSQVLDQIGIHEGVINQYHQQSNWNSSRYLEGLQMLEYDLLYGENYVYDGENPFQPSNLQLGIKEIRITDVVKEEQGYVVQGEGFTPYCRILFGGKEVDSEWIDSGHMLLTGKLELQEEEKQRRADKAEPDEIPNAFVVRVETGDGVELSMSKPFRWKNTSADKQNMSMPE